MRKLVFIFIIFANINVLFAQKNGIPGGGKMKPKSVQYGVLIGIKGKDTLIESFITYPNGSFEKGFVTANLHSESLHENWKQYTVHEDKNYVYSDLKIQSDIVGSIVAYSRFENRKVYTYIDTLQPIIDTLPFILLNKFGEYKVDTCRGFQYRYTGAKINDISVYEKKGISDVNMNWPINIDKVEKCKELFFKNLVNYKKRNSKLYYYYLLLNMYEKPYIQLGRPSSMGCKYFAEAKYVYRDIDFDEYLPHSIEILKGDKNSILSIEELSFISSLIYKAMPMKIKIIPEKKHFLFLLSAYSNRELNSRIVEENLIINGTILKDGTIHETSKVYDYEN